MAGDWIKVRSNICTDPRVFKIARLIGVSPATVVGLLVHLWTWADAHSIDGNALAVTRNDIDTMVGVTGFADALISIGWLEGEDDALNLPRFNEHNGETAKARALTQKRVAAHRKRSCNAETVTPPLPEKRREEINTHTGETRARESVPPVAVEVPAPRPALGSRKPSSVEECIQVGAMCGCSEEFCRAWYADMEVAGWAKVDGTPFGNWRRELTIARDRYRAQGVKVDTAAGALRTHGGAIAPHGGASQGPTGAQLMVWDKELQRAQAALKSIRDQYDGHMDWSESDRTKAKWLKARIAELKEKMGCTL